MSKIDMKRDNEKRFRSKLNHKHWRDYRLRELEKQLEFAECRCGTLKQQLDYIKALYGCGQPSYQETNKDSDLFGKDEKDEIPTGIRRISFDDLRIWNIANDDFPEGENKGKFLLPQTVSFTNTTRASMNSSYKPVSSKSSSEKKELIMGEGPREMPENRSNVKLNKGKRKKLANNSKHKLKTKGLGPRFSNATSQTFTAVWQDPVVEIYKNTAANIESESAADISYKNKRQKLENSKTEIINGLSYKSKKSNDSNEQLISPTKLRAFTSFKSLQVPIMKEEGVQTEVFPENESNHSLKNKNSTSTDTVDKPQTAEKHHYEPEPVKSYCQPTISSKKKKVERNFISSLNNLNLKTIPFIAATSTAPSHNIGVNIQQVLSIMKKRQLSVANDNILPILSNHLLSDFSKHISVDYKVTVKDDNVAEANSEDLIVEDAEADSKKLSEGSKSNTSRGRTSEKGLSCNIKSHDQISDENENPDWICKVQKLKKVLVFLHEDFTALSQKYKRLQKKLSKRNINKLDAKDELAEIERDLEKKEEEIIIVIGLYKEVLNLKEEVKKYQEKYNFVVYERALMMDGIKQSSSTHTQMSTLLRKIQQFQDQLKRGKLGSSLTP